MSDNPLDITYAQASEIPVHVLQALRVKLASQTGLTSLEDIEVRMAEYVHINSLLNVPSTLGGLNRRFGRTAKKCGGQTADIVQKLLAAGAITELDRGGTRCYVSTEMWKGRLAMTIDLGLTEAEDQEAIDLMMKRAE